MYIFSESQTFPLDHEIGHGVCGANVATSTVFGRNRNLDSIKLGSMRRHQ